MRRKNRLVWVVLCAALVIVSVQAVADTVIGGNFAGGWANTSMAGKTFDGLGNWTNTASENGSNVVMLGTGNGVTFSWSSPNMWYAGEETLVEQQLYRGYLDDGGSGCQVTITGLSAWLQSEGLGSYTIRVYQNTDNGMGFVPVDIKSGETILTTVQSTNTWTTDGGRRGYADTERLTANSIVLKPRTRTGNDGSALRATISGFKITGVAQQYPINPVPAVGQEVLLDQILSWEQVASAGGLGLTYNVYFGSDANLLSPAYYGNQLVKTTTADSIDFFYNPELDFSTTYYWRVDALEPNGLGEPIVYTGVEWSFITAPPLPRIDVDPADATVAAGASSVFSVQGINIVSYQWYKDGMPLTDTGKYSGSSSAVLTVNDIRIEEEGYYHCVVDNGSGSIDASEPAHLMIQRLVGWWKLDGDLTDSVDETVAGAAGHDGTSIDPNFVAGIDGSAIAFFGDVAGLVTVTNSAEDFNFYPQGYTISAWVQNTQTGGWAGYLSKEQRPESPWKGFVLSQSDGYPVSALRQSGDGDGLGSSVQVSDGAWHLVTASYDRAAGVSKIYVDGVFNRQLNTTGVPQTNPYDMIFGAELADGTEAPYIGLLDDIRIWNYPVDRLAIARLYVAFKAGSSVCMEYPAYDVAGPEGVGEEYRDCIFNLYDLAAAASTWLECYIVPDCIE